VTPAQAHADPVGLPHVRDPGRGKVPFCAVLPTLPAAPGVGLGKCHGVEWLTQDKFRDCRFASAVRRPERAYIRSVRCPADERCFEVNLTYGCLGPSAACPTAFVRTRRIPFVEVMTHILRLIRIRSIRRIRSCHRFAGHSHRRSPHHTPRLHCERPVRGHASRVLRS